MKSDRSEAVTKGDQFFIAMAPKAKEVFWNIKGGFRRGQGKCSFSHMEKYDL